MGSVLKAVHSQIAGNHNTTKMVKKAFIRLKLERKFRKAAYKTIFLLFSLSSIRPKEAGDIRFV
ncbi:MAG: hypothetical protein K6F84_05435 [Lachnospiraceae bacterium]|nr:hypothetical protein [Lachnospiraceae bacterium]